MKLVTLAEAARHLRLDTEDGDADLELKVEGASRAIVNYCADGVNLFMDSNGDVYEDSNGLAIGIPDDMRLACLFLIGFLDRNRDSDEAKAFGEFGTLPPPVRALLSKYHQPALA